MEENSGAKGGGRYPLDARTSKGTHLCLPRSALAILGRWPPQAKTNPPPYSRDAEDRSAVELPSNEPKPPSLPPSLESLCVALHGNRITVVASTIPRKLVRRRRSRNFDYAPEKWRRVCSAGKQPDHVFRHRASSV